MRNTLELIAALLVVFAAIVGAGVVAIASILGVYADAVDEPSEEFEPKGELECPRRR